MMPVATMTTKGQVTIPLAVREALRLAPGVRLAFTPNGDGSYSIRAATRPVTDLIGFFGPHEGPAVSIEDMNIGAARAAAEANR
jgi:AbrB family looped-hinge helix DNA binding protein